MGTTISPSRETAVRLRDRAEICGGCAGEQGFEPQPADPESAVLPLDDSPMERRAKLSTGDYNRPPLDGSNAIGGLESSAGGKSDDSVIDLGHGEIGQCRMFEEIT
jgi:hypothetical protein